MTIHVTFGISPSDCPGCGCNSGCPCNKDGINTNLTMTITAFTPVAPYTCPGMVGTTLNITNGGTDWTGGGFGGCTPFACHFDCVGSNFTIDLVFSADLSAAGTVSTAVQCTPTLEVDFTIPLIWSGFNGTTTCCGFTPDTMTATVVGTITVKITG